MMLRTHLAMGMVAAALAASAPAIAGESVFERADWEVTLAAGMVGGNAQVILGPVASVAMQVAEFGSDWRVFAGVDTGVFIKFSPTAMSVPLLVKGYLKYPVTKRIEVKAGAAIGALVGLGNGAASGLALLIDPGMDFWLDDQMFLTVDLRFGGFDGATVFAPRVGLTFPF